MREKIVIVTKEENNYQLLLTQLKNSGYSTNEIIKYASLMDLVHDSVLALVVLIHIHEPEQVFYDRFDAHASYFSKVPVIIISSTDDAGSLKNAMRRGIQEHLVAGAIDEHSLNKAIICAIERKRAENSHDHAKGNAFFDESPTPKWIYDEATYRILAVNKAAIRHYGYTRSEFLEKTILDIRPEEDREAVKQAEKQKPANDYLDAGIWRHIKRDGTVFYVRIYSQPAFFNGADARLVIAIDVNEKMLTKQENKKLYSRLEQQEKQYGHILASVTEVVWSIRANDYQLLYMNEACIQVFGYSAQELIVDKVLYYNLVHPEDKGKIAAAFQKARDTGKEVYQFRIIHRNGAVKHIAGTTVFQKGTDNEPDIYSGLSVDITDQVLIEEKLREKADEMENILETMKDAFYTVDGNWNFTYINKECERMYHIKREGLIGTCLWDLFPNAGSARFYDEYHRARREQVSVHFNEFAFNAQKWLMISVYPHKGGLAIYHTDITEQKLLEQKILKDKQNLAALINNTTDMIWSVDKELQIISANDAYKVFVVKVCGLEPEAGSHVQGDGAECSILKNWKYYYRQAFDGPFSVIDEEEVNGVSYYLETFFNPIVGIDGEIMGVSCLSRDISAQRQQMIKIQMQNDRLKEIAWIQSHRVRGPVSTIMGLIQFFDLSNYNDPVNGEVINGIIEAATDLDSIIREVVKKTYNIVPEN